MKNTFDVEFQALVSRANRIKILSYLGPICFIDEQPVVVNLTIQVNHDEQRGRIIYKLLFGIRCAMFTKQMP